MTTQNSGKNSKQPGRPENLKPWKKGQSGNPGGRPKKTLLSDALRAQLEQPFPGDRKGRTYAEKIAERIANEAAKKGSVYAASMIGDRTEGRPRQAVEVMGENGGPIDLNIQGLSDIEIDAEIRRLAGNLGLGGAKAASARSAKGKGKKAGKK